MKNFVFTNNIVSVGTYPVWSTGGRPGNCAYFDKPLTTFDACLKPYTFAGNVLIGDTTAYPSSVWPPRNFFPSSASSVRFVNYSSGNGGDYHRQPSSPNKSKGTVGKDPGAALDAINIT